MEGLSTVSEGTERGELYLSDLEEVSVIGNRKLRKKKRRWFLIQRQQKVVQKKKCDHGITCGSLVKNNVIIA